MTDFEIPPAAVEAAAKAEYEYTESDRWEDAHPDDRRDWLASAHIALGAAFPALAASVLRSEAEKWAEHFLPGRIDVLDVPHLLRGSARRIEASTTDTEETR